MKPGDMFHIFKFGELRFTGIYIGSSRGEPRFGRFLTHSGNIVNIDLWNKLVWSFLAVG